MAASAVVGNNLDTVRRHNLSTVLGLVHRSGTRSRSELTRVTGLNRSTIAALVGELVERGLVTESVPEEKNGVGRPSPVVGAHPGVLALAVNPEVDAVTVGVIGLDGTLLRRVRHATETMPTANEAVVIAAAVIDGLRVELGAASHVVGIGAAIPGLVRESDGVVRLAPHLTWVDEPFADMLADATGLPVLAANDANLGVGAEHLFGAGRGVSDLVYINGGASGIGAGVITGGVPLAGISGYAGELGHTLVNSAGVRCHCGAIGCLETEVSQRSLLAVLGLETADADELERELAASADPRVRDEVERQLRFLAVAVRNATNVFNPELIVLGGFLRALLSAAPGRLDELVASAALGASGESLRIARAELGTNVLMIGAAERAFERVLADPGAF
ncbi:ROK family transcriptional regulator [Microbacterium sp. STN6]|uniref:ROK family transcriptional regulator n=1 Tax=Microbacterium sp. STN6 TaxID=2995588 RepID=UPI002260B9FB|nr:ROK family transcriptional regulator [Microbacterium sp. STN6]MCX7520837.1 ROK family transcriptional regulator [Microbacterium sp. STN6]